MKKILILTNNDVGLYKFRKELIEKLVVENEVFISLPFGEYISHFEKIGCTFINTPINRRGKNPFTDIKLLLNYRKIISEVKPDVVLTYTIKPNVFGGLASRLKNVPYISNITGLGTAVETSGWIQQLTLNLYRVGLKKASCVFFQNEDNMKFFENRKIITGKQRLIPGSGVNLDHFKLLDYPKGKNIEFIFIARIMKEKGIDQYLATAEFIKNKYPNTVFHILGECEESYMDILKDMQDKGSIVYHGRQDDVREFHNISNCTIHPTYYPEGMSNVLLESAACGRPIITTDRPGCKEIVDKGINGYVVKERNSNDLIKKVEEFLKLSYEEKRSMGLNGREKVEKEFSRKIVVDSYMEEIFKEV